MKEDMSWLCLVAIVGLILLSLVVVVLAMNGYFQAQAEFDPEGEMDIEIEVGERSKKVPSPENETIAH